MLADSYFSNISLKEHLNFAHKELKNEVQFFPDRCGLFFHFLPRIISVFNVLTNSR